MPAYLVTLNREKSGHTLPGGADAVVCFADDATQAKEVAASYFDAEGSLWTSSDATATAIVQDADFNGWTFKVRVLDGLGAGADEPGEVIVVGDATDNTIDEIAALLVTALNALTGIDNASYNGTTNTLTVAAGSGGDDLGDQTVEVEAIPPGGYSSVPSVFGTITHEGVATDDLTVVLPLDADVYPLVFGALKQTA